MEQVDKGAIRFVLSGANIMCPGLTSPGAHMTPVPKGTVVVSFQKSYSIVSQFFCVFFLNTIYLGCNGGG